MEIHAHRGGPLASAGGEVVPALPEEAMRAFERAHDEGYVVELDAKVTRDGVPVVIHDATLDRTTDCSGLVRDRTAAEVAACRIDVLGTEGVTAENPDDDRVPRLDAVLDWAGAAGARLNLEIKNIPTEPDFDSTPRFAEAILDVLDAARLPDDQLLVQSFWPPNLDLAKARGWRTALLTLNHMNRTAPAVAAARGYDLLSPEWPVRADFMSRAGDRPVLVWTLNDSVAIEEARALGVAGIISDNPGLVRSLAAAG